MSDHVIGRRLCRRSDAARAFAKIERWLGDSQRRTFRCRDAIPFLPKRVIDTSDVGNGAFVRLVDFSSCATTPRARYVCLSHRWGNQKLVTTTKETLQERLEGISFHSLSQTFRDAVLPSRKLQIRYLWIDSLCIIQGDKLDWEIEAAKMGRYYRNSWLTIGAGLETDGLFSERRAEQIYYRLPLMSEQPSIVPSSLYITAEPTDGLRTPSPLYSRAWVFQEEVLSSRFLSFEPTQLWFRDSSGPYPEFCFPQKLDNCQQPHLKQHINIPRTGRDWATIVERFSTRKLTFDEDKLPALSGLAHEYSIVNRDDDYLAGIWRSGLPFGLLWCRSCRLTFF